MEEEAFRDLETIFSQVEDPRLERTKRQRSRDIPILAMCGVICRAEGVGGFEPNGASIMRSRGKRAPFCSVSPR
jgi:hypothetical protein